MSQLPTVSIVLPIRNEERYIERVLIGIYNQDYPLDLIEIVIADGMSTDETKAIISHVIEQHNIESTGKGKSNQNPRSPRVQVLDNPGKTMPTGANLAIRNSSSDVIILLGGHALISKNYVSNCVRALEQSGTDCVGGPLTTVGEGVVGRAIAIVMSSKFGVGSAAFRTSAKKGKFVDTVAFGAYRRQVFDRIGFFDEALVRNQDDEFNSRLIESGGKIWLAPSITSTYYSRSSLQQLWQQYYGYGLYKIRVFQKLGTIPAWRQVVPSVFVTAIIFGLFGALATSNLKWILAPTLPYILANLSMSLWNGCKDSQTILILPIGYFILHFSYGTGILAGIWRWRSYWGDSISRRRKSNPSRLETSD